jgi:CDP-6-deoxy-D-xylo-4-hexulose-3-dehydrase
MFALPCENFVSNFAFPTLSYSRDRIIESLEKNNVECRPLIAGSIGRQPFWIKKYGFTKMKNADIIHNYGMYVPNNHEISIEDITFISDIINDTE